MTRALTTHSELRADFNYQKKLESLTDLELMNEEQEKFFELFFFLVQFGSVTKDLEEFPKRLAEVDSTLSVLRGKINAVKSEVARRDLVLVELREKRSRRKNPAPIDVVSSETVANGA